MARHGSSTGGLLITGNCPEVELLLRCARVQLDPPTAARICSLVQGQLDWVVSLMLALRHGVLPLLARSLRTTVPDAIDAQTLADLEQQLAVNRERNLQLVQEVHSLLSVLKEHNIRAISFKGPVLAVTLYGDLGLRQSNDLDLLVHPEDIAAAGALLESHGYHGYATRPAGTAAALRRGLAYEYPLVREDGQIGLDLHSGIMMYYHPFPLSFEHLWERLIPLPVAGWTVPTLPPEELLLMLCAHGTKHRWEALKWICDVAELVRGYPELQWDIVVGQARELGSLRMLLLGVELARALLEAPLPDRIRRLIAMDPMVARLAGEVQARLIVADEEGLRLVSTHITVEGIRLDRYWFVVRSRERLRDRATSSRHLARILVTPTDADRLLPLPAGLGLLALPVRLGRAVHVVTTSRRR